MTRFLGLFLLLSFLFSASDLLAKDCPRCSQESADAARFCRECGHSFAAQKICPHCSREAYGDAKFCPECGHRFEFSLEDEKKFVKKVVESRDRYEKDLLELREFYRRLRMKEREAEVEKELAGLREQKRVKGETPDAPREGGPAVLQAVQSLPEADEIFARGEKFRRSANPFTRKSALASAVDEYQKILLRHPTSDKADDAAYWLGAIYESIHYENFQKALEYYRLCVQSDPRTDHDARYRIAVILDYNLKDRESAAEAYKIAAEEDPVPENREKAKSRLRSLTR